MEKERKNEMEMVQEKIEKIEKREKES